METVVPHTFREPLERPDDPFLDTVMSGFFALVTTIFFVIMILPIHDPSSPAWAFLAGIVVSLITMGIMSFYTKKGQAFRQYLVDHEARNAELKEIVFPAYCTVAYFPNKKITAKIPVGQITKYFVVHATLPSFVNHELVTRVVNFQTSPEYWAELGYREEDVLTMNGMRLPGSFWGCSALHTLQVYHHGNPHLPFPPSNA